MSAKYFNGVTFHFFAVHFLLCRVFLQNSPPFLPPPPPDFSPSLPPRACEDVGKEILGSRHCGMEVFSLALYVQKLYIYIYTWECIKSVRQNILICVHVSLTTHCEVLPPQNPTWCQNGNRPASALDLLLVVTSIVLLYVTSWVRTFWLLTAISISLTYYESNIWLSPKLSTYAPWCT